MREKPADLFRQPASVVPGHLDEPTGPVLERTGDQVRLGGQIGHDSDYAPFGRSGKPSSAALYRLTNTTRVGQLKKAGLDVA